MAALILAWLLIIPATGLLAVLAAHRSRRAQAWLVLLMSLASLGAGLGLVAMHPAVVTYAVGGWDAPLGIVLVADGLSRLMILLTGGLFTLGSLYRLGSPFRIRPPEESAITALPYPLMLLALNGLFVAGDFFNFYVFFELVAVSSYLLVALGRHWPLEAAWKYSAQSVLGSLFLLMGICLLYGRTGALTMAEVAVRLDGPAAWVAPFFLVAFLLKGALFPFHFWQPDAHAAATTSGSVLLAGLLIKVGVYGLFRFWPLLMGDSYRWLFLGIGAASVMFGATAAWRETDAKRLLGFSSISQLGFVLVGLGWGTVSALGAALYIMVSHSLAKALLFMATGSITDRAGSTRLSRLAAAGKELPLISAAYLVGMLSLVGLPPTGGFIGKLSLLREGARLGEGIWLGIAAGGSLLTLGYAIKTYQRLFWGPDRAPLPGRADPAGTAAVTLLALLVLLIGVVPEPLWQLCHAGARDLQRLHAGMGP